MSMIVCFGYTAFASGGFSNHNEKQSEELHLNNLGFGSTRWLLFSTLAVWQFAKPSVNSTAAMSLFISPCLLTYNSLLLPLRNAFYKDRKFLRSCLPESVRTDSGWNWTPSILWRRWRRPMMMPSSVSAVMVSSRGKDFSRRSGNGSALR